MNGTKTKPKMSNIISRLTMKNTGRCLFVDKVSGKEVILYVDKYGDEYMANHPFFPWSFRCKTNKDE